MGPRAGLGGRKILSQNGFDPGPSSPQSVAMPTEIARTECMVLNLIMVGVKQAHYYYYTIWMSLVTGLLFLVLLLNQR